MNVWYAIGRFEKGPMLIGEHFEQYDHAGHKLTNQTYRGFDNDRYCLMLDHHALPQLAKKMSGPYYFQQQNAPHHSKLKPDKSEPTANPILRKHEAAPIKWPALSLDSKVIENVHTLVQALIDLLLKKYRSENEKGLFSLVKMAYSRVDSESSEHFQFFS